MRKWKNKTSGGGVLITNCDVLDITLMLLASNVFVPRSFMIVLDVPHPDINHPDTGAILHVQGRGVGQPHGIQLPVRAC